MIRIAIAFVAALLWFPPAAMAADDADAIRHLLSSTFDRPDSRLVVDPVVLSGDHAIAGWSQGDLGGRALLRRKDASWSLILCSGDGIRSSTALLHAGVPAQNAEELARKLAEAESRLPQSRLALFAKFEGTMMMNPDGSHPTGHGTAHGAH